MLVSQDDLDADQLAQGRSPVENAPELVFVDPNGNCFLQNDTNQVMEQHRGEVRFSAKIIETWRRILQNRGSMLTAAGIAHAFVIAPDKQSVYWDQIGGGSPDIRNSLEIFNDSLIGVNWVDPIPTFKAARDTRRLYPLTDSHWDAEGAYLAYLDLMARLPQFGGDPLREGIDFDYADREMPGDLGNKFPVHRLSTNKRLVRSRMRAEMVYRGGVGDTGCVTLYRRPGLDTIGILFADSFGRLLAEFLAEHFGTLIQVHGKHFDADMIHAVQPNAVIMEGTERFMAALPILEEDQPTELLFMRKIAKGRLAPASTRKQHVPLQCPDLTPAVMALVRRNEALTQLVLDPATRTDDQAWFNGDMPPEAGVADVLVAAFLGIRRGVKLEGGWRDAYLALPRSPRHRFEISCGRPALDAGVAA
jgi:hypothetical protein